MDARHVSRGLAWFSIGLGLAEIVAGREMGRMLGMERHTGLLRAFGLREIGSGVAILAQEDPAPAVWSRVVGDFADLAVLASAYTADNPKRGNVALAIGAVAGVTAVDIWCARTLQKGEARRSREFTSPDVVASVAR